MGMIVHLVKLCVGIESVAELSRYRDMLARKRRAAGKPLEDRHVTRHFPRRAAEILAGGSLYWVIRGAIQARHAILRLDTVKGKSGRESCAIVYDPTVILTRPQPRRAFQGWRYLEVEDAPPDLPDQKAGLAALAETESLPAHLREELRGLGLI